MDDSTAKADCPCIDSSRILSSRSNCVLEEDGSPGVWVPFSVNGSGNSNQTNAGGACYPVSYGANECAPHDMKADPRCKGNKPPGYCIDQFCYVDPKACKLSTEFYFSSDLFEGSDLYYSYSTCNSTEDEWLVFDSTNKLDGLQLSVAVPAVLFPNHYKLSTTTGEVADFRGDEYYDDTVPWVGWQLDYFKAVAGISNIGEVTYTHQSKGSDVKSPGSSWTATVHDIQAGISCLAVSNFWITAERLKLTTFTAPISSEKIYMFIKSPAASSSGSTLAENAYKTLAPFEPNLWFLTIGLVVFVAILSVIFANEEGELSLYWETMRSPQWKKASYLGRAQMFSKMGLESFLIKSTYAVTQSAGVNTHNSTAQKFTNVGFAFFILILVSAYTANLAAFLTVSLVEQAGYIKDMEDAIARGVSVCAAAALKDDLFPKFPDANFLYYDTLNEQLEAYDAGDCPAILASPHILVIMTTRMKEFCKRELVMTGQPVLEIPIGFPVCSDLAGGISHWIYEAQKRGITYMSYFEQNLPEPVCSFDIPEETGDSDMARLKVEDFALPLVIFMVCIGLAILSHAYEIQKRKDDDKKAQQDHVVGVTSLGQPPKTECTQLENQSMTTGTMMFDSQELSTTLDGRKDCMTEMELLIRRENDRMLEKIAAVVAKEKDVHSRYSAGSGEDGRSTHKGQDWIVQDTKS